MSKHNNQLVDANNAAPTFTYTIQADATSGDTYALKYDSGNQIVAVSGPLNHHQVRIIQDQLIAIFELTFEPIDDFFYNPELISWQPPTYTYQDRWGTCVKCDVPVYGMTTCHLCQYLMANDTDALTTIGAWMSAVNMEPHAAAYAVSLKREREANERS